MIRPVQYFSATSINSNSISVPVSVTAGNLLHLWTYGGDGVSVTFSDTLNGAYGPVLDSFLDPFEGNANQLWAQDSFNGTAGGSNIITANFAVTIQVNFSIFGVEIAGQALPTAIDGHLGNFTGPFDGTPTNSITPGNVTSAKQPALVLGFCGNLGGNPPLITQGTGFTLGQTFADDFACQIEFKRVISSGTQAATWTASGSGANPGFYDCFVAVYDEAPSSGVPSKNAGGSLIGSRANRRRLAA